MFAIAFDLDTKIADQKHPGKSRKAYADIEATLRRYQFERSQWSVYTTENEDLSNLFSAIDSLRSLEWFGPSVKSIRAFRMEQGSDFTAIAKAWTRPAGIG